MARKPNREETLKIVRERVVGARNYRRHERYDDLWNRLIDLYRGRHFPPGTTEADLFVINVSKATIDVILPSVAVNYPKISVVATNPDDMDKATIAEAVVNYWWRHYDVLPEFQAAVKDFLILGFGWMKTGYRVVEEVREDTDGYEAEVASRMAEVDQFAADNPLVDGAELPTEDDIRSEIELATNTVITESRPFAERVSPFDVFVDPEAKSLRDARWIAQRVVKSLSEVQNNEDYSPKGRKEVKADARTPDEWEVNKPDNPWFNNSDDSKRVTVYEYYDLVTGKMCVFSEAGSHFLIPPTDMPYEFGHPFIMMRNYDVPDQFYPMGELEALEPLQNELNLTRTQMFADRKAFRRKLLVREGAITPDARAALESDDDNQFVFIPSNEPFDQIVARMPVNEINPALFQDSQVIEQDLREVSGVSEYMRGVSPDTRQTATEASIIQGAADARAQDKLARIEQTIGKIGQRLVQLAQQYMDETQTARIAQQDGKPFYFDFTPDDIKGEFDFIVTGGSTKPRNEGVRREEAMQMLQALAPFGDPAIGLINMGAIIDHVLREGFGINDTSKFMGQGPQMMQGMGMPPPPAGALPPGQEGAPPQGGPPQGAPPQEMAGPPGGAPPIDPNQLPPEVIQMIQAIQMGEVTIDQLPPDVQPIIMEILGQLGGGPQPAAVPLPAGPPV